MSDTLEQLIQAFRCLPGVGPKSAQRMVFYLLQKQKPKGLKLAELLKFGLENIRHCIQCRNYTDQTTCKLCLDYTRDKNTICIVEGPGDLSVIEQTKYYKGLYFVLHGKISPLDGIGPKDLKLEQLVNLINQFKVKEIIIAISPNVEGQTTSHFIKEACKGLDIKISQLAHGIPSGGELEYLDLHTIGSALRNRNIMLAEHE